MISSIVWAMANGQWVTRFFQMCSTFFLKTRRMFPVSRQPPDSKNDYFPVTCPCTQQHLLLHTSTSTQTHHITSQHTTTQYNTPPHTTLHTTHSAPATLYNMSEARHHFPQQDQARSIQSVRCCCSCLLAARCRCVSLSVGVGAVCGVFCMWCLWCCVVLCVWC